MQIAAQKHGVLVSIGARRECTKRRDEMVLRRRDAVARPRRALCPRRYISTSRDVETTSLQLAP